MTRFITTNSVFINTNDKNSFSITIPGRWDSKSAEKINYELSKIKELRSENDIELHVKEVKKRGTRTEIKNSGYKLAGFDQFKNEKLAELKRIKYKDLEDLVYRLELIYDEFVDILNVKYIPGSRKEYTLPPGV